MSQFSQTPAAQPAANAPAPDAAPAAPSSAPAPTPAANAPADASASPATAPAPRPGRVLLLGGPYSGRMRDVEDVNQPLMLGPFKYHNGANLPGDIKDRLAPQSGAYEVFGFDAGEDDPHVRAMKAEYPETPKAQS